MVIGKSLTSMPFPLLEDDPAACVRELFGPLRLLLGSRAVFLPIGSGEGDGQKSSCVGGSGVRLLRGDIGSVEPAADSKGPIAPIGSLSFRGCLLDEGRDLGPGSAGI